jgi:hypothetical protein
MSSRPTLLTGKRNKKKTSSSRLVLKTINDNAGTPAVVVDMAHGDVSFGKAANSVDKIVDKDPKNQHEAAVKNIIEDEVSKNHEDTVEDGLASRIRSNAKQILKWVAEKGEQPPSSNVEARQLAIALKALDEIALDEMLTAEQKVNANLQRIECELKCIYATLNASMRLLVSL